METNVMLRRVLLVVGWPASVPVGVDAADLDLGLVAPRAGPLRRG